MGFLVLRRVWGFGVNVSFPRDIGASELRAKSYRHHNQFPLAHFLLSPLSTPAGELNLPTLIIIMATITQCKLQADSVIRALPALFSLILLVGIGVGFPFRVNSENNHFLPIPCSLTAPSPGTANAPIRVSLPLPLPVCDLYSTQHTKLWRIFWNMSAQVKNQSFLMALRVIPQVLRVVHQLITHPYSSPLSLTNTFIQAWHFLAFPWTWRNFLPQGLCTSGVDGPIIFPSFLPSSVFPDVLEFSWTLSTEGYNLLFLQNVTLSWPSDLFLLMKCIAIHHLIINILIVYCLLDPKEFWLFSQ